MHGNYTDSHENKAGKKRGVRGWGKVVGGGGGGLEEHANDTLTRTEINTWTKILPNRKCLTTHAGYWNNKQPEMAVQNHHSYIWLSWLQYG